MHGACSSRRPGTIASPPGSAASCKPRQDSSPKSVRDIAWRAQLRLSERYRRLSARHLPNEQGLRRHRAGAGWFIWDIARQVDADSVTTADQKKPYPPQGHPFDRRSRGFIDESSFPVPPLARGSQPRIHHHGGATRCAGTMRGILDRAMWASLAMIPGTRVRQPRDGPMNCGIQPANISMIHRRNTRPRVALPLWCGRHP